jgi:hypothetical protein
MFPYELSVPQIERARVRLLFLDADFRQVVDQHLGLDLEFAGQFVDSDLIGLCHALLSELLLAVTLLGIRRFLRHSFTRVGS